MEFIEELFRNPSSPFITLFFAVLTGFAMWKQFGGRPWLVALWGFLMLILGWFTISAFSFSFYPPARQILAILLLAFFGIGLSRIPGRPMSIIGGFAVVIAVLAIVQTPPVSNLNVSAILEGQVLNTASDIWQDIWSDASEVVP